MGLYSFRYRAAFGAHTRQVEASTLERATLVAEKWCAKEPGRRFIPASVEPTTVADESILGGPAAPVVEPVPEPLPDAVSSTTRAMSPKVGRV